MSLQDDENLSARSATAPRVTLRDLENAVIEERYINAGDAVWRGGDGPSGHPSLSLLTLCFLTCANGFVVVGKSAPASAENFDEGKGRIFAKEDAMRQLWPLMGYALRNRLAAN